MKNLSLISFVGIDTATNLEELKDISSSFASEFSVLSSSSKSLTKHMRYPSYDFCKNFLQWSADNNINGSLHLCGDVIIKYLEQDPDVLSLCENAFRIQLNLNIASFPNHNKLTDDLITMITKHKHQIILQQNKTKAKFMEVFMKSVPSPINLLHDSSGGFGREISVVEPPHPIHFTGYAGGIKPENVKNIVDLIEKTNIDNKPYYIDMESGVREDNIFSLKKCRQIIQNLT